MKNYQFLMALSIICCLFHKPLLAAKQSPVTEEKKEVGGGLYQFIPPKGWECIDDKKQLPGKVELVFLGTAKGNFTPSINLATEETSLSIQEYVALAKNYHESQGETVCRSLGSLKTAEGEVQLLQIDRQTQFGLVRFLQGSLIKDKKAYVITATCLQEDFNQFSAHFFRTIQSFTINPR